MLFPKRMLRQSSAYAFNKFLKRCEQ